MTPPRVLIWDRGWAPHRSEFTSRLGQSWRVEAGDSEAWLLKEVEDAAAMIALGFPPSAMGHTPALQAFLYPGAGLLTSDPAAYPAGCPVINVYEHETGIAEYVLMMMLAHVTGLRAHLDTFASGRWQGSGRVGGAPHGELSGKTVGILGFGRIGQAVAMRARAFGMTVIGVGRERSETALDDMLRQSDFLVVAAPLTAETNGLIDARALTLMRRDAFLINVSRAEVVCEQALYDALSTGRIAGAALDVWYRYPSPGDDGHGSALPFHTLPGVYCTPHYSGWTWGTISRRIDRMCETLARVARGEPLERIVLHGTGMP